MREIEIKLKAPDLESVASKLRELGCVLSEPKIQEDRNFIHKDDVKWFEPEILGFAYPRFRFQPNKPTIFTVKKPVTNESDCIEYEMVADDPEGIVQMMKMFDYFPGVTVKKTRRTCVYKDYTITLDEVDKLGKFIEIEKVMEDGNAAQIQEEMFAFAKDTFGLERDGFVMKGYDIMMYHLENK